MSYIRVFTNSGFALIILMPWINEVFDLPHYLLGAEATPVNWAESLFESGIALFVCLLVNLAITRVAKTVTIVEGFTVVCRGCKAVREGGQWVALEDYLSSGKSVELRQGLCPQCAQIHPGEVGKDGQ